MLQLLPIYINDVLKVSTLANGIVSALPIVALFLAKTISSSLSSIILSNTGVSRTTLVKLFNGVASLGLGISCGVVPLFNSPDQKVAAIVALCLANTFAGLHTPGVQTALLQLAPAYTGIVTGIAFGVVGIFGIANKVLNNWIVKRGTVAEWTLVFMIAAVVALLPVIFFSIWGSAERQQWASVSRLSTKKKRQSTKRIRKITAPPSVPLSAQEAARVKKQLSIIGLPMSAPVSAPDAQLDTSNSSTTSGSVVDGADEKRSSSGTPPIAAEEENPTTIEDADVEDGELDEEEETESDSDGEDAPDDEEVLGAALFFDIGLRSAPPKMPSSRAECPRPGQQMHRNRANSVFATTENRKQSEFIQQAKKKMSLVPEMMHRTGTFVRTNTFRRFTTRKNRQTQKQGNKIPPFSANNEEITDSPKPKNKANFEALESGLGIIGPEKLPCPEVKKEEIIIVPEGREHSSSQGCEPMKDVEAMEIAAPPKTKKLHRPSVSFAEETAIHDISVTVLKSPMEKRKNQRHPQRSLEGLKRQEAVIVEETHG